MEDNQVFKEIILEGVRRGFKNESFDDSLDLELVSGHWILSNGVNLGPTWAVIFSPEFANTFWDTESQSVLQQMVIMSEHDRAEFLRQFLPAEYEIEDSGNALVEFSTKDSLMRIVMDSNESMKEESMYMYRNTCEQQYNELKKIVDKKSITELEMEDFVNLNLYDRWMNGAISKYLNENGKASFTICPECGVDDFTHIQGCSIQNKADNWIYDQESGGC